MPLAVPCTAHLPFPKMNSTLLVLGRCLGFCSLVCPSPAQVVPLLLPLTPLPGSPKLQLSILSGGSTVGCPVLNCFGLWSVQAGLLQLRASLVLQSHQQPLVLQLDLLPRLFPCLGTLDELVCSPGLGLPEETSQEDFFPLQKWVWSQGIFHLLPGRFISGLFWEGAAQYLMLLPAINVLAKVTPDSE